MVFPMNEHYFQNSINYELDHIRYPASSDIQPLEIKYARRMMLMKGRKGCSPNQNWTMRQLFLINSHSDLMFLIGI